MNNERASKIIADLMFAYVNKDEDIPHSFEIEAFEEGLCFLQEHYMGEKFNVRWFEDRLNKLKELNS
jgi:hypothetical protein